MSEFIDECEAAGLDPIAVRRIASRLSRAARDAEKLGLTVFGGSGFGTLRSQNHNDENYRSLVVADIEGGSWDGGDGSYGTGSDGLQRGEGL